MGRTYIHASSSNIRIHYSKTIIYPDMKRFYPVVVALIILFASTKTLISQHRSTSSDTMWTYYFTSPTDSSFQHRNLHTEYDSTNIIVKISLESSELHGDWESGSKIREFWNPDGSLSTSLESAWNAGLGQWEESTLLEFFMDEYGSDTLFLISNKSGDEWVGSLAFRTICTYNGNGQLIQEISLIGPPGMEIENHKFEYTLDASGNRISTLRYNYETDWVLSERVDESYDDQDREVEQITYSRSGEQWVEQSKRVHTYNDEGKVEVRENHEWNAGTGEWAKTSEEIFTYNADGEWSLRTQNNYDLDGSHWSTNRHEYSYYPSGKLEINLSTIFDEEAGLYISYVKQFYQHAGDYFFHYDTICSGEVYTWKGGDFQAGGIYRQEYMSVQGFDSIYALSLQENPTPASFQIDGLTAVNQAQEALYVAEENPAVDYGWMVEYGTVISGTDNDSLWVRWDSPGNGEVKAWALSEFGCSSDTLSLQVVVRPTGIEENTNQPFRLYPVPVKDHLIIESLVKLGRMEVLDANGRIVLSAIPTQTGMDLSTLERGIYLVRLRDLDGKLVGTRKILKE
jgi:hypothetical protein